MLGLTHVEPLWLGICKQEKRTKESEADYFFYFLVEEEDYFKTQGMIIWSYLM